jgi:hypothetical protein
MGHRTAVAERGSVAHPLPYLGAADFGGGSVFHQVVDGNTARSAQPRLQILQAHINVPAQTFFGDLAFRHGEQVLGGDVHILAAAPIWFACFM